MAKPLGVKPLGVRVKIWSAIGRFQRIAFPPAIPHQCFVCFGVMNPRFTGHSATLLLYSKIVVCCVDRLKPQPKADMGFSRFTKLKWLKL